MRWTAEQVLALAPDAASRRAGSGLGLPGPWSETGGSGTGAVWGLCRGSDGRPYRTVVDSTGPAYRCSCPSRRAPCRHALGLLLLWAGGAGAVPDAEAPGWAEEWLAGRSSPARRREERAAHGGPSTSAADTTAADTTAADTTAGDAGAGDPGAARRRAERRAARITAGARELEQRLADLLRGGLASAAQSGYGPWEETAARMVDAQAPGLAARVRELGALAGSGQGWPARLLEESALVHLLDRAWLEIDRLPEPLAAVVRTRVGLTATAGGPAVRDDWLVLAQYDSADAKLTTRRIWLRGRETGRTALLLSYGAAGRAPGLALPPGLVIDAEIVPYGGAGRLRAELRERFGTPVPVKAPPPGGSTEEALAAYGRALRDDPWLDAWPVTLEDVVPVPSDDGWQLADARGPSALPVAPAAGFRPGLWRLLAVSGGGPVTVFGECGHRGFAPLAAWSGDSPETVALTSTALS
ncbi:SWIM zinc finger family protein [Streptomyces spongiicola]|uniref:SWIM zinc finger family protein n=1 Tax=Streptomyces spongiicola TaxID=1690221 RepID=UPI000E2FF24A|nr:SWIM zinc finger family protein [Streptomyces spongiicola]